MSQLIQNWLNNEIELSQPVTDFEKDFANGYLFGELLFKFNQQSDFKDFSKQEAVADKLENFKRIEPTLRSLKIKFSSIMVNQIMQQTKGVSLRILYQLKMALEKAYPPTDIGVFRKTGKMGDNQPALKIAPTREQYDALQHKFFEQRLQELNKPQKTLNMEMHLSRFPQEKERQARDRAHYLSEEVKVQEKIKQDLRKASINKLQRNAGFMEEWLQKGVDDWRNNITVKKDREKRQLEFEYKQATNVNKVTMSKIQDATKEVHEGITNFEKTLKNQGIATKMTKEDVDKIITQTLTGSPLKSTLKAQKLTQSIASSKTGTIIGQGMTAMGAMTLTSSGLKTKDKKTITEKVRKDRERRRRKMIVDQSRTHYEMESKRRESHITQRMQRQAKQEEELSYEEWRTVHCKDIIDENRLLREARYEQRRDLDQQLAITREQQMMTQLGDQMQREADSMQVRSQNMLIYANQAKRVRRTEMATALLDAILDISNEAYIHEQKNDSSNVDSRNWREWLQLFIEQQPISGTLSKLAELDDGTQDDFVVQEDQNSYTVLASCEDNLNKQELLDYLQNNGQWPTTLITENKLNLESILTGVSENAPPQAKGKGAPAQKQQQEQITLEEGDTELTIAPANNYFLGDAVSQIVKLNYAEPSPQLRQRTPSYLPLKICMIGYPFAGKKTCAQKLAETYNLDVFSMEHLVEEALQFADNNPYPIPIMQDNPYNPTDDDVVSEVGAYYNAQEDFRSLALQVRDYYLLTGTEIPDSYYIDLFLSKLRMKYPVKYKSQIEFDERNKIQRQYEIQARLQEIDYEIQGIPNPDGKRRKHRPMHEVEKEQQQLQDELASLDQYISTTEKNGWVLIDFPSTYAQAKILEGALTSFYPKSERIVSDREKLLKDAQLLAVPSDTSQPDVRLINSGLDCIIWLDADQTECIRRAIGRRFDNINESILHIQDSPPLTTNAPLCERLTPIDNESNAEQTLVDRMLAFDQGKNALTTWLTQFGYYDPQVEDDQGTLLMQTIFAQDYNCTWDYVQSVIQNLVNYKTNQYLTYKESIRQKIRDEEQQEKDRIEKERLAEERRKYIEERVAKGESLQAVEEDLKKQELQAKLKYDQENPQPPVQPEEKKRDNIDQDFQPVVMQLWNDLLDNYKSQMKRGFKSVRNQRERIFSQFSTIEKRFLYFLHKSDVKQAKLETFITNFNQFSDEYPDLREDDHTKDELHQRVDILTDELWEITEERKDQAIEERQKIMQIGWIEYELDLMTSSAQKFMQTEVDRFRASIQLLQDYYHAIDERLIAEAPAAYIVDIAGETEELPAVETLPEADQYKPDVNGTYPRLDKLFEKALKAQFVPDVTQIVPAGQDGKKAAAGKPAPKKGQVVEEEKPQEESLYMKEMKESIKTEKSILRFRLTQIRNWTLKRLRELRQRCNTVYQKLEDWILVSVRTENDAMDQMGIVIKRAIEEEKKIQTELRIKFMDFCVDEKIMNYIEPPPPLLPAMEEVRDDRLNIKQLHSFLRDLGTLAHEEHEYIKNNVIVDYFIRKLNNSKSFWDDSSFPKSWNSFTIIDFQTIIKNLDKQNLGRINWRYLATYICLLKSPIADNFTGQAYEQELKTNSKLVNGQLLLKEEDFIKVPAWFDDSEISVDRYYSVPFERVRKIKKLLFDIHAQVQCGAETDYQEWRMIDPKDFVNILRAKELLLNKKNAKDYSNLLFVFS